jgi:DNA-binding NtrC family response regulator
MDNCNIKGAHPVVEKILSAAVGIARIDVGVLIVGEKGTGKELLARYIHDASPRAAGPFVRVDCQDLAGQWSTGPASSGITREVKADALDAPVLDRARGGTLFLDHISAFGPEMQARLLSSLIGGSVANVDVRLLAAREPSEAIPTCLAVAALALVEIPIPALRHRRSDIPVLVDHFLAMYSTRHGTGPCQIERDAMVHLWQYDWPGNVRELETLIERVVVLNRTGRIRAADLPSHIRMNNALGRGGNCGSRAGVGMPGDALAPRLSSDDPLV